MQQKLTDLGWVYYNDAIHITESETEKSNFHKPAIAKDRKLSENVRVKQHHCSETSQLTDLDGDIHD